MGIADYSLYQIKAYTLISTKNATDTITLEKLGQIPYYIYQFLENYILFGLKDIKHLAWVQR